MTTPREDRLASELGARLSGCPESETLLRYAERTLGPEERRRLDSHVAGCRACTAALQSLEVLRESEDDPQAEVPAEAERRSEQLIGAVTRGELPSTGWSWPLALRVAAGLFFVAALAIAVVQWTGPGVEGDLGELRGDGPLELIAPLGTLGAAPEEFRWHAHPGADAYRVTLLDAGLEEVWSRRTDGADPVLVLDAALRATIEPGSPFTWQVEALDRIGAAIDRSASGHFSVEGGGVRP